MGEEPHVFAPATAYAIHILDFAQCWVIGGCKSNSVGRSRYWLYNACSPGACGATAHSGPTEWLNFAYMAWAPINGRLLFWLPAKLNITGWLCNYTSNLELRVIDGPALT